jgi:hypothetical protein
MVRWQREEKETQATIYLLRFLVVMGVVFVVMVFLCLGRNRP